MATARKSTPRKSKPTACPDCHGKGETAETVRVGSRRASRETADQQAALCLACFGTGEALTT